MRRWGLAIAMTLAMAGASALASGVWPQSGAPGSLEWALKGSWRSEADVKRDSVRHPVQELKFMGLKPNMTVLEIFPGGGYFTAILGPVLKQGGGKLIVVGGREEPPQAYKERFLDHPEIYSALTWESLNANSAPLGPDNSADLVVTFRNVHNWMAGNYAEKAFAEFFKVLKPGGLLGLEEHRAKPEGEQDPKAASGYVQEAYVKKLAKAAGFELVKSSELLANPKDTKDHPFGVWTLPPVLLSSPVGQPPDPNFDHSKYVAIGEADNMLLLFRKPK